MNNFNEKAGFICSVANPPRGPLRPNQYKVLTLSADFLERAEF